MKNILKYIWALPALLLAACSQDEMTDDMSNAAGEEVIITVNMPEDNDTRVLFDDIAAGSLKWDEDDELLLYDLDEQGKVSSYRYVRFTMVGAPSGSKAQFRGVLPADMKAEKLLAINNNKVKLEDSDYGMRPDLSATLTQNGNNDASHLANFIHMGVKCTGEQLQQSVTLKPLCSLATIRLESWPAEIGNIRSLDWIMNFNKPGKSIVRTLNMTNAGNGFNGYILFYPDEMKLLSGGNIAVRLNGDVKSIGVKTDPAAADKMYECGKRYIITASMDAKEGVLSNWQDLTNNVAVAKNEIWAVASGDIAINPDLAAEWEVTKTADGVFYSIHKIGNAEFTEVPSNLLEEASNALLKEIYFAEGIVSIGVKAFSSRSRADRPAALTTIQIPASLTTIGADAFNGCSSLKNLKLNDNMTLGANAFQENSMNVFTMPAGTTDNDGAMGKAPSRDRGPQEEFILSDNCKILSSTDNGAYGMGVYFKKITVKAGATVTLGKTSFFGDPMITGYDLVTFNFLGTTGSSIHPGFMKDAMNYVSATNSTNLILNVDWLNPGDDTLYPEATAELRTPKQVTDAEGKVTGGTWMGYTWKSITFVNHDGSEITDPGTYEGLKGSAVWGDPNAILQ